MLNELQSYLLSHTPTLSWPLEESLFVGLAAAQATRNPRSQMSSGRPTEKSVASCYWRYTDPGKQNKTMQWSYTYCLLHSYCVLHIRCSRSVSLQVQILSLSVFIARNTGELPILRSWESKELDLNNMSQSSTILVIL